MVAEGGLQDRQAFVAVQTVHAHFGLDQSADRPALDQAGISPTTDFLAVSADLAGQVLDLIGAHQGATEILGHAKTDAGQHVVHTVTDRAGNVVEAPREVVERLSAHLFALGIPAMAAAADRHRFLFQKNFHESMPL